MAEDVKRGKNFDYFYAISRIPRGSFREKAVVDYIEDFAKAHGLSYRRDDLDNIIIRKPASAGREGEPPVILQAHTDMVCNKVEGCPHDFLTEGIDIREEDGWLTADGTTLGADDGAGVANILAILDDETASHPPLECILTVQEEDGMGGAKAIDLSDIKGRRMIGLDGMDEGATIFSASSVKGIRYHFDHETAPAAAGETAYELRVSGLTSGHGALCIGMERANAVKISAEILREIGRTRTVRLASMEGGGLIHVIPGSCRTVFLSNGAPDGAEPFIRYLKTKYEKSDSAMRISLCPADMPKDAAVEEASRRMIRLLYLLPAGAERRDPDDLSRVSGSFNLSILTMGDGKFSADLVCRANYPEEASELYDEAAEFGDLCGLPYETTLNYARFYVPVDAPLVKTYADVYREMSGRELEMTYIHSGIDAGEICQKLGMDDAIVLMPTTVDVHTPDERMNIASFARTYEYLKEILKRC